MRRLQHTYLLSLSLLLVLGLTFTGMAQTSDYYDSDLYDSDTSVSLDTYDYEPTSGTAYDWQSGNSYSWRKSLNGSTTVNGHNLRTGSTWQTTIEPDGDMSRYDSDYNYWDYESSTETYYNYGTGEMRISGDEIGGSISDDTDLDTDPYYDYDY